MSAAWKKAETQAARVFGAERRPLSGMTHNTHGTGNDDAEHDKLYIETKYTASKKSEFGAVFRLVNKTVARAELAGKTPIIALRRHGSSEILFVVRHSDLDVLLREYRKANWRPPTPGTLTPQQNAPSYNPPQSRRPRIV